MRKKLIMPLLMVIVLAFVAIFVPVKSAKADGYVCRNVRINTANPESGLYETLSAALTAGALQNGDTIEMIDNYRNTSNTAIPIYKTVTLDLMDYNLEFAQTNGGLCFTAGVDYNYVNLTIRASGSGCITKSGGSFIRFQNNAFLNVLTVQSGTIYNFAAYDSVHGKYLQNNDHQFAGHIVINGGSFTFLTEGNYNNFKGLISDGKLVSASDSPTYRIDVKPSTYVTGEDTKASAKLNYTEGYSYYRKVTSLSSADAGKSYVIAYVNQNERAILLLCGDKVAYNFSYIASERHYSVGNNENDTWRIVNNSTFYGDVNENYFYTLGYDSGQYTFINHDSKYLTNTSGESLSLYDAETIALNHGQNENTYIHKFHFTNLSGYLSVGAGTTKYLCFDPAMQNNKYYTFAVSSNAFDSGLGDIKKVRAYLFEKVDVDPVVNSASLRFGQTISKDMYDFLSGCGTTVTFGVIAKLTSALGGNELEYANAQIKKTITPVRVSSAGATEEDLEGDYYQFALVLSGITSTDYETSVTARCFVCIDGHYYYFNPSVYSLKTLANAYYNADDTSAYTDHLPVLGYLKDYGD